MTAGIVVRAGNRATVAPVSVGERDGPGPGAVGERVIDQGVEVELALAVRQPAHREIAEASGPKASTIVTSR